eukprot:UN08830
MIHQKKLISSLREDGRRFGEIRPLSIKLGINNSADGSCEYKQGLTHVLVTIEGPKESFRNRQFDQATLNLFITTSAFARGERKQDPRSSSRKDR